MSKKPRTKLLIDRDVQMAIVARVIFYWAGCSCFISMPLVIGRFLLEPEVLIIDQIANVFYEHWSIYLVLFVMLPFAIYDALRLSNRFAGPVFQIRKSLVNYNQTGRFTRVAIRKDDFWHDLADEVNKAVDSSTSSATRDEAFEKEAVTS